MTLGLTRLRDDYLAIVTLGFAEAMRIVAENEIWLTKGTDGISGIPQPLKSRARLRISTPPIWCSASSCSRSCYSSWNACAPRHSAACCVRSARISQVAAFAGKDVLEFKVKAFAIGGALAGLAGALYAHYSASSCRKSMCRC